MLRNVITSPYLENGGVAQFIKSLSPFFLDQTLVFKRGKRAANDKFSFFMPFIDIFRFMLFLIKTNPKRVIINSSLAKVGIIRDGFFILVSKLFGFQTILYIHGFDENSLKYKSFLKIGYFRADKIFVLSSTFKEELQKLGYLKPVEVTYNPVSLDLIKNPLKKIKLNDKNNIVRILMMSRITKSKGIFIGLEAFKGLVDFNIELHVAGTGSDLDAAKEYVKLNNLKNVFFHGFISGEKKMELFKYADILLFPTYHKEGLPLNVLESLTMGLYVITRPVAGINDLIEKYHLDVTDSLNPNDFETIIREILKNGIPENIVRENQLNAKVDFSPETIINKIALSN